MTYLLFAVALSLSAVAAYYAVMGLVAIFAAAVVPIAIMGSLLEVSKLTVASWLYQNWKKIPTLLKSYFTIALVVLMLLTSMGIFGFLSKAHLDQAVPTGDVSAKLALIDEKIKTEKENLNANRTELNQLDTQVNQTMSRTDDSKGAERAIAIRRGQQKDRARILAEIGTTQAKIAKLQEERAPIASEVRKVEAEVGPIKYIAALIYDQAASEEALEKAVRIVTIMIVLVFDPLAVLLLIAANWQLRHEKGESAKHPLAEFFKKNKSINDFVPQPQTLVTEPRPISDFPDLQEFVKKGLDDGSLEITGTQAPAEEPEDPFFTQKEQRVFEEATDTEIPEIEVEEAKDWEPELYQRLQDKQMGRYEAETRPKTQSFLSKVKEVVRSPDVRVNTIEADVEDLQSRKS
jgi:hypothetical protein